MNLFSRVAILSTVDLAQFALRGLVGKFFGTAVKKVKSGKANVCILSHVPRRVIFLRGWITE